MSNAQVAEEAYAELYALYEQACADLETAWKSLDAKQRGADHLREALEEEHEQLWQSRATENELRARVGQLERVRTAAAEYLAALRREQREVFGNDDAEIEALLDAMCGDDEGSRDVQVKRRALIAALDAKEPRP